MSGQPEAFAIRHNGEWHLAYQVGPSETYPEETYAVSEAMDVIYRDGPFLAEWLEAVVPLRPGDSGGPAFTAGLAGIVEKASALADGWDRLAEQLQDMHGTKSAQWVTYHCCAARLRDLLIAGLEPLAKGTSDE